MLPKPGRTHGLWKRGWQIIISAKEVEMLINGFRSYAVIMVLMALPAAAGSIFIAKYQYQADISVYVTDYEYQADAAVWVCDYEYQAEDDDCVWYFCDYEYQADVVIYYVDYEYQADLKVFFCDYEYQSGWKEPNSWMERMH